MSTFPRWLKTVLVLAAIIMLAGIAWHYRKERSNIRNSAIASLEAITQLKADRVAEWWSTRLGEATVMMASRFYSQLAARWMETSPTAEEATSVLSGSFLATQRQYRYQDALFVGAAGRIYFHMNAQPQIDQLHEVSQKALAKAFSTRTAVLTDLYRSSSNGYPQVDLILPFFANTYKRDSSIPSGAIIFQYDATQFLYPLIQFWPIESYSAETLIVRREGGSVLFLNELRHQKNTALTLRIPLAQKDDFAVKAVLEKGKVIQGRDYRHAEVLAVARSIPDTTWLVISKEDVDEAFSTLQWESILMLAMFAFLIASVSTALGILWRHKDKAHYRAMFEAEAQQSKGEERYRNTLDGMMEGCHIIDFEWRYIYVNDSFARQSRRSKEELLDRTIMECFPGIENAGIFPALRSCMNERKPRLAESAWITDPDGSKAWLEFNIQPSPEGIFVLTIDISQRKQAEESLRESEAKYRALFEHMAQGAFRQQADGKIVDVNPAALRMYGLTRDEFMSKVWQGPGWDVICEDDSPFLISDHPLAIALKSGNAATAVAGVLNPKSQTRVWMEINAIPEFSEGDGKPSQVLVTLYDITDRKQAEIENARLASAIEQSGEIIVIIDSQRIIRYINPVFETITGYRREEAIGHPLPSNETRDSEFTRGFWETLESGKSWRGRLVNRKKDGTLYTEEATVSPVFNAAGAIANYVSVTRDISEYLRLQSEKEKLQMQVLQAQKMESVGRLAGGVAHDFNNMLNVIIGHAQLSLEMMDPAQPVYGHLQEINRAALRSADLTRQLLAFARKQTVAPRILNLNNAITGSLSMLQRLIGEDIDLAWIPCQSLWPVKMDPAQIDQILANLAVNARDAIDKNGKITIETDNVVLDEAYCANHAGFIPGKYVMLALSDNGCGMDKSALDHLFEPFFTTKEMGEGTGLGLATVYGIIRQNEGFINVYSESGKGSVFKIYLPHHSGPEAIGKVGTGVEPPKGGSETILIVEDEASVMNLAKLMLERLGYKVIAASKPSEALHLAENYADEIHLLLVDVVMPEATGRDLSERLRALRPKLRRLFMSGYTANVIAHHGVLEEGVHFIQKPFSARALAAKVREALES